MRDRGGCGARGEGARDACAIGACGRGVAARTILSLLLWRVPSVIGLGHVVIIHIHRHSRARWVPAIGSIGHTHERHGARTLASPPGGTSAGDGLATGIGAGGIMELDPRRVSWTVGALEFASHPESRRVWTGESLDPQVPD